MGISFVMGAFALRYVFKQSMQQNSRHASGSFVMMKSKAYYCCTVALCNLHDTTLVCTMLRSEFGLNTEPTRRQEEHTGPAFTDTISTVGHFGLHTLWSSWYPRNLLGSRQVMGLSPGDSDEIFSHITSFFSRYRSCQSGKRKKTCVHSGK